MRFSVYLKQQDHTLDPVKHKASRSLADQIVGAFLGRLIGQNAIQLTTDESWRAVKNRFRARPEFFDEDPTPTRWQGCDGGQLKPPRPPEGLLLTYPLRNQTSYSYSYIGQAQ